MDFAILSHGRTGSTFLQEYLDNLPGVACVCEAGHNNKTDAAYMYKRSRTRHPELPDFEEFREALTVMPLMAACGAGLTVGAKEIFGHQHPLVRPFWPERTVLSLRHPLALHLSHCLAQARGTYNVYDDGTSMVRRRINTRVLPVRTSLRAYKSTLPAIEAALAEFKGDFDVAYHEIVEDPAGTLRTLCDFLRIPFREGLPSTRRLPRPAWGSLVDNYAELAAVPVPTALRHLPPEL